MKRTYLLFSLGFFFLLIFPSLSNADDRISIRTSLSESKLTIHKDLEIYIVVTWPKDQSGFDIVKISPPESSHFDLIHASQRSSSFLRDGKSIPQTHYRYLYKATQKGEAVFSPFALELRTKSGNIILKRGEENIVFIVSYLGRFLEFLLFLILLAAGGGSIIFVARKIKNAQEMKLKKITQETRKVLSNEFDKETLGKLKGIRKILVEGDNAKYFTELRKVLEGYLNRKYEVSLKNEKWQAELQNCEGGTYWSEIIGEIDEVLEGVSFAGAQLETTRRDNLIRKVERQLKQQNN